MIADLRTVRQMFVRTQRRMKRVVNRVAHRQLLWMKVNRLCKHWKRLINGKQETSMQCDLLPGGLAREKRAKQKQKQKILSNRKKRAKTKIPCFSRSLKIITTERIHGVDETQKQELFVCFECLYFCRHQSLRKHYQNEIETIPNDQTEQITMRELKRWKRCGSNSEIFTQQYSCWIGPDAGY